MSQLDFPSSPSSGQTYSAPNGVNYTWDSSVGAGVWLAENATPLAVSAGSLSGTPDVGKTLTYTQGSAVGGVAPYTYTWDWKKESDGSVVATDVSTYVIPSALLGDRVYVELTATDSASGAGTASTPPYPSAPSVIALAPITGAVAPTTIPGTASFTWADPPGTLTASGCIEFSVDGGGTWVTSAAVTNAPGSTVMTRWINTPSSGVCGDTAGNATITGDLTSSNGETTAFTLVMDRTPDAFTLSPNTETASVGQVTVQDPTFTVSGTNAPSYIWGSFTSTGSTPEYTVDGGTTWTAIPTALGSDVVDPGATVSIRFTTAAVGTEVYTLNVGASTTAGEFESGAFTVTVVTAAITNAVAPSTVPGTASFTWADGAGSLTATGCIEYSADGGSTWTQAATAVNPGDTILTRWEDQTSGVCGQAPHGTTITGTLVNGSASSGFSLTLDRVPDAFSLSPNTETTVRTLVTTADPTFTIAGTNAQALVWGTLTGGGTNPQFTTDGGGTWQTLPSSPTAGSEIPPGATATFRFLTSSSLGTETLDVFAGASTSAGEYQSDLFTVSVVDQPFPSTTFSPAGAPNAAPAAVNEPAPFMSADIRGTASGTWADGSATLNGTNIELSIGAGGASSSITPVVGDTVNVIWDLTYIAGLADGATASGSFTDNRYTNNYTFTVDKQPAFTLPADSGSGAASSTIDTGVFTPNDFNCTVPLTYTAGTTSMTNVQASINGGALVNVPTSGSAVTVDPGDTVRIYADLGATGGTTYSITVNMGASSQAWDETVVAAPYVTAPTISAPTNGATDINPAINTPSAVSVTASAFSSGNGAGTDHASSDWELATDSGFSTVVYSSIGDTSNLTTWSIPEANLTTSTTYYLRVRYNSGTASGVATTSPYSSTVSFTTASSFTIPIGTAMEGGYFAGQIMVFAGEDDGTNPLVDTLYNLIVSPRSAQVYKQYATSLVASPVAPNRVYGGQGTVSYGTNTAWPMFYWCISDATGPNAGTWDPTNAAGTGLNGYNDWYIPSQYEFWVLYFNMKPSFLNNVVTGSQPNSVSPYLPNTNFQANNTYPGTTSDPNFQGPTGSQRLDAADYWTSFGNGFMTTRVVDISDGGDRSWGPQNSERVRVIRRVPA